MDDNVSSFNLKNSVNIMELFEKDKILKICAPMVRYSKLQFRNLVRSYGCDLCFTPMIIADSFCLSQKARSNEFTTNLNDSPLIAQFAANTVHDFVGASYIVSPFCDGVDLNCGCPQRWAKQQGLGCIMLQKPEKIYDIVRQTRNTISKPFTVSVKMRLNNNLRKSVEICQRLEHCGVSFLTVHARTADQLTGEINTEALALVNSSVGIPVVANGGVKTLEDCHILANNTNCQGIMVANALLTNPTLFTGNDITSIECLQKWVDICYNSTLVHRDENSYHTILEKPNNLTFQCFHHHLVFMLEKLLTRPEKRIFNNLQCFSDVLNFLKIKFDIEPTLFKVDKFQQYSPINLNYSGRDSKYLSLKPATVKAEAFDLFHDFNSNGKFFSNKAKVEDDVCDWSDMFLEQG